MVALLIIFLWPLWFVVIASISDPKLVLTGEVLVLPKGITLNGFIKILQYDQIWIGYRNTIFYTLVGTFASLALSICMAFAMSEKSFAPRNILMVFFMITMYFSGGLIPTFLLMKSLKVLDTPFAMWLRGLISVYNSLIIRSYFTNSIPGELREAATLDGAGQGNYLIKILLPLSKPVFAVVGLYYAVGYWNSYTKGLYPFIQKHFVKGVMVGAVKG